MTGSAPQEIMACPKCIGDVKLVGIFPCFFRELCMARNFHAEIVKNQPCPNLLEDEFRLLGTELLQGEYALKVTEGCLNAPAFPVDPHQPFLRELLHGKVCDDVLKDAVLQLEANNSESDRKLFPCARLQEIERGLRGNHAVAFRLIRVLSNPRCPGTGQIAGDAGIHDIGKRCGAKKIPDISVICSNHIVAASPFRMEKEVEGSESAICSKDSMFPGKGRSLNQFTKCGMLVLCGTVLDDGVQKFLGAQILKGNRIQVVIPADIPLVGKMMVFLVLDVIGDVDLRSVHSQKTQAVDKPWRELSVEFGEDCRHGIPGDLGPLLEHRGAGRKPRGVFGKQKRKLLQFELHGAGFCPNEKEDQALHTDFPVAGKVLAGALHKLVFSGCYLGDGGQQTMLDVRGILVHVRASLLSGRNNVFLYNTRA